jgi:hypothetical protein
MSGQKGYHRGHRGQMAFSSFQIFLPIFDSRYAIYAVSSSSLALAFGSEKDVLGSTASECLFF